MCVFLLYLFLPFPPTEMSSSSSSSCQFDAIKATIKAELENERPDTGLHDQWIRSKLRALQDIKSETDLVSGSGGLVVGIGKMDPHMAVSQMIHTALSKALLSKEVQ